MAALGALLPALSAVGTVISTVGTLKAGADAKAKYQYEQKVARQQADEAEAASQRDAGARYKEGELMLSQQRAAIAGSGGDISDPSVIDIMGDTQDKVSLAGQTEIYKGKQQAAGYNDAAQIAGINASNAMSSAWLSAGGNLFSGVSSMYERFGKPQQKTVGSSSISTPYGGGSTMGPQ